MTESVKGAAVRGVSATQQAPDFGPLMVQLGQALAQIGEIFLQQVLPTLITVASEALQKGDGFERGVQGRLADRVKPLELEAARRKDVPFFSQWDAAHVPGAGEGASYKACRAMAHAVGVKLAAGPGDRLDVASEGLHAVRAHVDEELAHGRPVALAVARDGGTTDYLLATEAPEWGAWTAHDPFHKDSKAGSSQLIKFDEKRNAMVHHDGDRHGHVTGAVRSQGPAHVEHHHAHDHAALKTGPVAGIRRGANAAPIPHARQEQLAALLQQAGARGALLTSTSRTPKDQARIMFNNLQRYGAEHQHKLYAGTGDRVIDVYQRMSAAGASPDAIKAAMTQEVLKQGPSRVSRHCAPEGSTVVDIAPGSLGGPAEQRAFMAAVEQAQREGRVKEFLHPGNSTDPAFHVEFA